MSIECQNSQFGCCSEDADSFAAQCKEQKWSEIILHGHTVNLQRRQGLIFILLCFSYLFQENSVWHKSTEVIR